MKQFKMTNAKLKMRAQDKTEGTENSPRSPFAPVQFLMLALLVCARLHAADLGTVMVDSTNKVQRPANFWSGLVTSDSAFSNAVNAVAVPASSVNTNVLVSTNTFAGFTNTLGSGAYAPAYTLPAGVVQTNAQNQILLTTNLVSIVTSGSGISVTLTTNASGITLNITAPTLLATNGDGSGLTNLNASNISTGTNSRPISIAGGPDQLTANQTNLLLTGTNVMAVGVTNTVTSNSWYYSGGTMFVKTNLVVGAITGNGAGLTNLNAANVASNATIRLNGLDINSSGSLRQFVTAANVRWVLSMNGNNWQVWNDSIGDSERFIYGGGFFSPGTITAVGGLNVGGNATFTNNLTVSGTITGNGGGLTNTWESRAAGITYANGILNQSTMAVAYPAGAGGGFSSIAQSGSADATADTMFTNLTTYIYSGSLQVGSGTNVVVGIVTNSGGTAVWCGTLRNTVQMTSGNSWVTNSSGFAIVYRGCVYGIGFSNAANAGVGSIKFEWQQQKLR